MSKAIQIKSSSAQQHQEIRRSESFGNFTPSSFGTPYHQDGFANSPGSRSRTISTCSETLYHGIIKKFSRTKGHGFIEQASAPNHPMIYFHVCDIFGELVPQEGDSCVFRVAYRPPRDSEKAVEVKLQLTPEQLKSHETWQAK